MVVRPAIPRQHMQPALGVVGTERFGGTRFTRVDGVDGRRPPTLRHLRSLPEVVRLAVPSAILDQEAEWFVVVEGGRFGGQDYRAGEVLLCCGAPLPTDETVLVPRGLGHPRMGSVDGARLRGDVGEPCLPARFRTAGRLVARIRREADEWVARWMGCLAPDAAVVGGPPLAASAAVEERGSSSTAQLPLFACAA